MDRQTETQSLSSPFYIVLRVCEKTKFEKIRQWEVLKIDTNPKAAMVAFPLRVYQTKGIHTKAQSGAGNSHSSICSSCRALGLLFFFFLLSLIFHLFHVLRHELDEFYPADMLLAILPRNSEKCSEL